MKPLYRRDRQQHLFGLVLGVFAMINLLFFFILYRPSRTDYYRLQESIEKLRIEVQARKESAARLEKLSTQLETSEQDRTRLFMRHFLPRATGYSQILPKLNAMAQSAGVQTTRKDYMIDETPKYGLYSVIIRVPVTGGYSSIVQFIKDIETSETFFIINSIDLHGDSAGEGAGPTEISMAVNLETFFYQ